MRSLCAAFLLSSLSGSLVLGAQTAQPFSVQASGLLVVPTGEAFSDTETGPGFEVQVRRNFDARSLGIGFQWSSHGVTGADNPLSLLGVFAEPRYVLPAGTAKAAPYISGRVAVFQQRLESEGTTGSATGAQLNAGGGMLISLSPAVNLDLGATVGLLRFGAYEVRFPGGGGFEVPGSSGANFVLRAGLAVGLGKVR